MVRAFLPFGACANPDSGCLWVDGHRSDSHPGAVGSPQAERDCQGKEEMIHLDGPWFKDESGRVLLLHGVNLGGSSKVPAVPDGATFHAEGFFDHRNVSFINRPFPLDEADEHFSRLKAWGFNTLRFLVTWEGVEHSGPGIYDAGYLDYLHAVIQRAGEYGFSVFIDPHQDVWSRFTGVMVPPAGPLKSWEWILRNSKAPELPWCTKPTATVPRMIWPTNNNKFAAATLFTLFFGGNDFAPHTRIDGIPVQEFLQSHYINAMMQVANKLADLPNVIGYNTLNEPARGYIGISNLNTHFGELQMGVSPTPWQSMLLAAGLPQKVDILDRTYFGVRKKGDGWLNQEQESLWLPGHEDIWQQSGVWKMSRDGQPQLLKPDYFQKSTQGISISRRGITCHF